MPPEPSIERPSRRSGRAVLPVTSWTLLAEAAGDEENAKAARDELTVRYYRPIRAYIMAIVRDAERTDDLTQSFFERHLLSGRLPRAADRGKGSFRAFMKQALRNFISDDGRRLESAGARVVRPDGDTHGWDAVARAGAPPSAETEYHNAWVRALLEATLEKVRETCEARGQAEHFQLFAGRYLDPAGEVPSWRALGERFGLDEKAARNRTETVARHLRILLRRTLIEETGSVRAADDEVAALLGLL